MVDHDKTGKPGGLKDFEQRLEKSLEARKSPASEAATEGSAAGLALRVITELAVGIAVTMGLGWMADRYFGTAPWIMLALMPLGFAAGIMNVMRLASSKRANEILDGPAGSKPAPSVKDDGDED